MRKAYIIDAKRTPVGKVRGLLSKTRADDLLIHAIQSVLKESDASEEINKKCIGLELDYTFNMEDDPHRYYYRSDHYNFAKNNIPVIFYFNGVHEDYHKTTDTIEKIDFDKIEKITRFVFLTAWELANREERIKLNFK